MLVRGIGIRDIAEIEEISTDKVLSVLSKSEQVITPKQSYCPFGRLMNFGLTSQINRTRYG